MVPPPTNHHDRAFLQAIRRLVEERLGDPDLCLDDLCRAVHLCRTQVYRRLKKLTGLSPTEYIQQARLERARQLLSSTGKPVSEVGYEVGFRDPAYFSRVFKTKFHLSPTDFRRSLQ